MRNLQEATERICELKGSLVALDALLPAFIDTLSADGLSRLTASFNAHAEAARTLMLHSEMSDLVLTAFEREVARNSALLRRGRLLGRSPIAARGLDPLLLSTTRVSSFLDKTQLSGNTGFFFRRGGRLFLVSTRQAMAGHHGAPRPDRIEIEVPADTKGEAHHTLSLPTSRSDSRCAYRCASDVDVAVMPLDPAALPASALLLAFDESHLETLGEDVGVGDPVSTVSFPLDDFMHAQPIPLALSGAIASSYGLGFENSASFLTHMHSHPGSCGSPVVRRRTVDGTVKALARWHLIGIQGDAADASRDGPGAALHRAWYADILLSLSENC
jgi:hypothetical protein